MTTYYVDADSGSDANGGTGWGTAKEHIQAAIDLITSPITDNTVIKLKAGTTNPYEEDVEIGNIVRHSAAARLAIEPEVWNQDNYDDVDGSPFNAASGVGTWDIKADDKPCVLKLNIKVENTFLQILGVQLEGALQCFGMALTNVIYSRVTGEDSMLFANGFGGIGIENCFLYDLPFGMAANGKATLTLNGNNYIENPFLYGIWANLESSVYVSPWGAYYTTEIKTTMPRLKDYAAVRLTSKSYMNIKDGDINPFDVSIANVKVVNDLEALGDKYYGVLVESASILDGASLMSFVTKNKKGDYVDMPEGQQIVGQKENGALLID
jgi:hypothetical protein